MRRANSLPIAPPLLESGPEEESEEESDLENRRMSLQLEEPLFTSLDPPEQRQKERYGQGHSSEVGAPFKIFADDSTTTDKKKDDFASGVARARELLNRPRLMNLEGNLQHRSNAAGAGADYYSSGATGSTFYKNFVAHKKNHAIESAVGQGIENMKPAVAPEGVGERKPQQGGSATKRCRFDYESGEGSGPVPLVQVDLHSLMMAGRGKFENL